MAKISMKFVALLLLKTFIKQNENLATRLVLSPFPYARRNTNETLKTLICFSVGCDVCAKCFRMQGNASSLEQSLIVLFHHRIWNAEHVIILL